MAQDDYYYEIQLTNKQLVFYFMAGAAGLILSFLAGVMIGRGAAAGSGEVQAARPVAEERVVAEEMPKATPSPVQELHYAERLDGERRDDSLEKGPSPPAPSTLARLSQDGATATVRPAHPQVSAPPATTAAAPAPPKETPAPAASPKGTPKPATSSKGAFTIQVGAFKDKASAESVVARLKGKGFAAYVVAPEGAEGLYNVRVGNYAARADADRVKTRLQDQEKFKPFIVKQ